MQLTRDLFAIAKFLFLYLLDLDKDCFVTCLFADGKLQNIILFQSKNQREQLYYHQVCKWSVDIIVRLWPSLSFLACTTKSA